MRSRFGGVVYMSVVGGQPSNCGFAPNCKDMILTAFPGIPRGVFDREDIKKMMFEVDNVSGALYVIEPVEGDPLIMNSTLEGLQKEYDEWLDRTSQQCCSQSCGSAVVSTSDVCSEMVYVVKRSVRPSESFCAEAR